MRRTTTAGCWLMLATATGLSGCWSSRPKCDASNCGGCCDHGDTCQNGSTVMACGTDGGACESCGDVQICQSSACINAPSDAGSSCIADAGAGTCPDTWTTWASGFFAHNCSRCHWNEFASYAELSARPDLDLISGKISFDRMPPPPPELAPAEKARILDWFDAGMPH